MRRIIVIVALSLLGCTALKPGMDVRPTDGGQMNADSGPRDSGMRDGGARDSGTDAGGTTDSDAGPRDAGTDAGPPLGVRQLALGMGHTCLLDLMGRTICWGANDQGQLGRPVSGPAGPAVVAGAPNADEICAGGAYTCARLGPDVVCWGGNTSGELGNGTVGGRTAPSAVALPAGVVATRIACGLDIACAVTDARALYCWGDNETYQIAPLTTDDVLSPTEVSLPGLVEGPIAVGASHTCAVLEGAARGTHCWGDNTFGQIDSSTSTFFRSPQRVGEARTLITAGARHTCSYDGRSLQCRGQTPQSSPVPSLPAAIDIGSGESFSCGHTEDRLICWGEAASLQLGGTESPNLVEEARGPIELLGVGRQHGCVVDGLGLLCWGQNGSRQIQAGLATSVMPTRIDLDAILRL